MWEVRYDELCYVRSTLRSVYTKRQRSSCNNSAITLMILFSLKTMESLENGLQPAYGQKVIAELLQH